MRMWKMLWEGMREGMMYFGERTSAVVNTALLTAVYCFGVGIMSILARVMGKKFLDLRTHVSRVSYWVEIHEVPEKIGRYYRQF